MIAAPDSVADADPRIFNTAAADSADVPSQRWRNRRHTWRRKRDGGFDADLYEVVPLSEAIARSFVERHHYAGTFPAARFSFGLLTQDERLEVDGVTVDGLPLVGVAVLSVPMRAAVLSNVFANLEPNTESLELGRLVLTDTPSNAESWFMTRVFAHAAQAGIRGVVSFSDPMPRTRTVIGDDGAEIQTQTTPGHCGVIYQALSALALGRSTPRTLTYLPRHGTVLSDRTLQKIRTGESGSDGAERRMVDLGASPRRAGEPARAWLRDALHDLGATRIRHPGNHRYAFRIGSPAQRRRIQISMPITGYPKPDTDLLQLPPAAAMSASDEKMSA